MARFQDDAVVAAFSPHLQPGEKILNYAFGVKQPHLLWIVFLVRLAILPGVIAAALLTKNYIVALTDRRFLVLRIDGGLAVKEILEYARDRLPPVRASTGALFTHIRIDDAGKPFVAKFHRLGMAENRKHSMAIAEALKA